MGGGCWRNEPGEVMAVEEVTVVGVVDDVPDPRRF